MPIKKAARKAQRQRKWRTERNRRILANLNYLIKQSRRYIDKKDKQKAKESLARFNKAIDKAVQKGIVKPNTASRKKSRLAKKVWSLLKI